MLAPLVDSNQVFETSRIINGNWINLRSISSLIAKGLNTYVNKIAFFFANISKTCFHFVIMGYCVQIDQDF